MRTMFMMSDADRTAFGNNWGWFLFWGIALMILGIIAISFASVTTLISVVFLGIVLTIVGAVITIDAFQFWRYIWSSFFIHLLMGILYLGAGIIMIKGPASASISITLLLAILYMSLGVFRIIYSLAYQMPNRSWRLFNGIVSLILGILILKAWPNSGLFIIGLFIGIDLLIAGWVYVIGAFAARSLLHSAK